MSMHVCEQEKQRYVAGLCAGDSSRGEVQQRSKVSMRVKGALSGLLRVVGLAGSGVLLSAVVACGSADQDSRSAQDEVGGAEADVVLPPDLDKLRPWPMMLQGGYELDNAPAAVWSPDGRHVVVIPKFGHSVPYLRVKDRMEGDNGRLNVGDGEDGSDITTQRVSALSFSPDGDTLAVSYERGLIALWRFGSGELLGVHKTEIPWPRVVWSPMGDRLVAFSASSPASSLVLELANERGENSELLAPIKTLSQAGREIIHAAWNADGSRLFTLDSWRMGVIWDAASWEQIEEIQWMMGDLSHFQVWSPTDPDLLVVRHARKELVLAQIGEPGEEEGDANSSTGRLTFVSLTQGIVPSVAWTSDGRQLAASVIGGTNQDEPPRLEIHDIHYHGSKPVIVERLDTRVLSWSADDQWLAYIETRDGRVQIIHGDETSRRFLLDETSIGDARSRDITLSWSPRGPEVLVVGQRGAVWTFKED